jgi:mono/diheme cytochrome c family protein
MNREKLKRVLILVGAVAIVSAVIVIFSYDVIKIDWVSFMKIQPAFQPMADPLPVPTDSIPVEGAAYIAGLGAPANPVKADPSSLSRGAELFSIDCALCHGPQGKGNGPVATYLNNKPADLTGPAVQSISDGAIFLVISNGIPGKMPALNENLNVRERWDVVNFVRTLKAAPAP